jgi:hypothetical protein
VNGGMGLKGVPAWFNAINTNRSMPGPGSPTAALGARSARYIVKCAPPMPGDMMCAVWAFDLHSWKSDR